MTLASLAFTAPGRYDNCGSYDGSSRITACRAESNSELTAIAFLFFGVAIASFEVPLYSNNDVIFKYTAHARMRKGRKGGAPAS